MGTAPSNIRDAEKEGREEDEPRGDSRGVSRLGGGQEIRNYCIRV